MDNTGGIKFFPTWINSIKKISVRNLVYPSVFAIFNWYVLKLDKDMMSVIIISLVFLMAYLFDIYLSLFKWFHKRYYYAINIVFIALSTSPFIYNLNLTNPEQEGIWYITSFLVSRIVFHSLYNWILPINREIKIKQKLYLIRQKISDKRYELDNLKITSNHLLIISLMSLMILLIAGHMNKLNIKISEDTLTQINVTMYAFILPIALAIITSSDYSKISKQYLELYQNPYFLFFFLGYPLVIYLSMLDYQKQFIASMSIFMILNTFVFMSSLAEQISSETIIRRLFRRLEKEILHGNYTFTKSIKGGFNWSVITGTSMNRGVIDKNKEFEYTIDLINQIAVKAIQNKDTSVFVNILRSYLDLAKFFLEKCKKEDVKYVDNILVQIRKLAIQVKDNGELSNIFIHEMLCDYEVSEFFVTFDFRVLNLQRFKLIISVAESEKENKERFNYLSSVLINILINLMMAGKFGPKSVYNGFSNQSYVKFKDTEEYTELREFIGRNKKLLDATEIKRDLTAFRYGEQFKKDFFAESSKLVLKALNLSSK